MHIHITRSITRLTATIDITTILIRIITDNGCSVNCQRDSTCNSTKARQVFCGIENVVNFVNTISIAMLPMVSSCCPLYSCRKGSCLFIVFWFRSKS